MSQTRLRILIAGAIILSVTLITLGITLFGSLIAPPEAPDLSTILSALPTGLTEDNTPLVGSANADVTLVYYYDYACHHCMGYQDTIDQVLMDVVYPGLAMLEFRMLGGLDPYGSALAAHAALCASEQGAFLTMHQQLIDLQNTYGRNAFTNERIRSAADYIELDLVNLTACIDEQAAFSAPIESNILHAQNNNVRNMPTLLMKSDDDLLDAVLVNGISFTNPSSSDVFNAVLANQQ